MIKYKGSRYKKEIQSYVNEHREYFGCLSWDDFLAIREVMNLNKKMEKRYRNKEAWAKTCLINIAQSGYFSSDRTIKQYAEEIWNIEPVQM